MLNTIIRFSIKQKLIVGIFTLALIVWGLWSANRLPVDALPDITDNQVQIITQTPTLAAQEVEQFVTYPIEKAMANLPDIEKMRSFSRFGLSVLGGLVIYLSTCTYWSSLFALFLDPHVVFPLLPAAVRWFHVVSLAAFFRKYKASDRPAFRSSRPIRYWYST